MKKTNRFHINQQGEKVQVFKRGEYKNGFCDKNGNEIPVNKTSSNNPKPKSFTNSREESNDIWQDYAYTESDL